MADEDIIELTQIVKPGNAPIQSDSVQPSASEAPPLPTDFSPGTPAAQPSVPDFGADLDALLQSCDPAPGGEPGSISSKRQQDSPEMPATEQPVASRVAGSETEGPYSRPVAAPIEDQHDTGRVVDPHEELDLPPLSDLDALLEELGVQEHSPAAQQSGAFTLGDDLDAFSASVGAAQAASAPNPESNNFQAPSDVEPLPSFDLEPDKTAGGEIDAAQLAEVGLASPSMVNLQDAAASGAVESDGIDLNELDALLDSVLAAAPKPAQAPEQASPLEVSAPPKQAELSLDSASELESLRAEVLALKAELIDLRANLEKYAAAAAAKVIREELSNLASLLE